MKRLKNAVLGIVTLVTVSIVLLTSLPKEVRADVPDRYHAVWKICSDGTMVIRCRDGGSGCWAEWQDLCPESTL